MAVRFVEISLKQNAVSARLQKRCVFTSVSHHVCTLTLSWIQMDFNQDLQHVETLAVSLYSKLNIFIFKKTSKHLQ